eukprot:12844497-Alexandrium_andersonii.AAC.1
MLALCPRYAASWPTVATAEGRGSLPVMATSGARSKTLSAPGGWGHLREETEAPPSDCPSF